MQNGRLARVQVTQCIAHGRADEDGILFADVAEALHALTQVFVQYLLGGQPARFVCLAQTSTDSGLWPLVGQRLVSVPTVALVGVVLKHRTNLQGNVLRLALLSGILDTTANGLYLISVRNGLLSLVAVITALYPVSTVMLAFRFDHERLHRSQAAGLILAAISLVMVGYASAL